MSEWHHNVQHRCARMNKHLRGLDVPCPECFSVETLARDVKWRKSYDYSRPERSAQDAGYAVAVVTPTDLTAPTVSARCGCGAALDDTVHHDDTDEGDQLCETCCPTCTPLGADQ